MPGNHSEIRGYSLTKIFASNRESSKNHKKNNLTKNFCRNSYVKTIVVRQSDFFSKKNGNQISRGVIFRRFEITCK